MVVNLLIVQCCNPLPPAYVCRRCMLLLLLLLVRRRRQHRQRDLLIITHAARGSVAVVVPNKNELVWIAVLLACKSLSTFSLA